MSGQAIVTSVLGVMFTIIMALAGSTLEGIKESTEKLGGKIDRVNTKIDVLGDRLNEIDRRLAIAEFRLNGGAVQR